ncbi:hypothetical protein IAT38_002917 [Cryptococcus sp. DSM 104549]
MPPTATRGTRQRFYNQLARNVRSSETFSLSLAPLDQHTNESLSAYGGARSSVAAPTFSGPARPRSQAQRVAQAQAQGGQGISARRQQEGVDLLDGWSERTRATPLEQQHQQTTAGRHPTQDQAQTHLHSPHPRHATRAPPLTSNQSQDIYLSRRTRRTRSHSTGSSSVRSLFRDRDREREHDRTPPPRKTVQNWLQTSSTAEPPQRQPSIPSSRDSPPPQQQQGQQRYGSTPAQEKRPQQNRNQKQSEQMQYQPSIPGYRPDQFQQPIYLSSPGAGVAVGGGGGGRAGYDRSMEIAALQEERKVYESLQRRLDDRSSQADSIETLRAANERLLAVLQQKNYALSQGQSTHHSLSPGPAPSLAPQSLSTAHAQTLPAPAPAQPQHTELHLEISRLQRELDASKRELDDKAERLAAAEKERDGAKKGQSTTAKVNHEMEVRVREAEERCRHEMGKCDALEKRLKEAENQNKVNPSMAKELEVKRNQLVNAHRERDSFTAKYRSLENDYAKLADKLKVSRVEKEALQTRIAELVAQQGEVEKLQADKKTLKDLLLKERADSDRLRKERAALREQLESRSKTKASNRHAITARETREPHRERDRERDRPRAEKERAYDDVPPDGIGYGTGKGEVIDDFGDQPSRRETGGRGAYVESMVDPEPPHRAQQPQPQPPAQTQASGLGKYSPLKPARQGPLGMSTPLSPSRRTAGSGGQPSMGLGLGLNVGMGMAQPLEPDHRRTGAGAGAGTGAGAGPSMSMPMGDRVSAPMNPNYHNPNPAPNPNPSHTHAPATGTSAFDTLMGGGATAPQQVDPFVRMIDVLGQLGSYLMADE